MLVAKVLSEQDIKVIPVCFESFFFNCSLAKKSALNLGLKLKVVDLSKEHLKTVKSPKHGQGKGINPCVDCHVLMIKKAREIMLKEKYDFLATGEVLSERPFSQNRTVFNLAEKELGLSGLILRPLSAQLLPETMPEQKKWVKREKLFGISGKSRKPQIALAKRFGIKDFPSPAGGCILTDVKYSLKLKELLKKKPGCDGLDCQILRKGRVFWQDEFLFVVGREEKDNKEILKLRKPQDVVLEPDNFAGPTVLVRGFGKKINKEIINKANDLLLKYSKKVPQNFQVHEI